MKPTFLYIKRHSITGLLYFGKTTKDPEKYNGSGMYWKRHIAKHGKQYIENVWYCLFFDREMIQKFAIDFSLQNNIVESKEWANQMIEDGINGQGSPGRILSPETRLKISKGNTGKRYSDEINKKKGLPGTKNPMYGSSRIGESAPHFGMKHCNETIIKLSIIAKEKALQKVECPFCHKIIDPLNAKRWHFNNCKLFTSLLEDMNSILL